MFLFSATDTCLCQEPGNVCVARSQQQACVTGTGTQGFLRGCNKTNERDHQKLSSLVGSQQNGHEALKLDHAQAVWMPTSPFSSGSFQTKPRGFCSKTEMYQSNFIYTETFWFVDRKGCLLENIFYARSGCKQ